MPNMSASEDLPGLDAAAKRECRKQRPWSMARSASRQLAVVEAVDHVPSGKAQQQDRELTDEAAIPA